MLIVRIRKNPTSKKPPMNADKNPEGWPPMDADERRLRLDQITEKIIGCVHQVSNVLGPGFLEKVYENATVRRVVYGF